jgi:hypothetical protein
MPLNQIGSRNRPVTQRSLELPILVQVLGCVRSHFLLLLPRLFRSSAVARCTGSEHVIVLALTWRADGTRCLFRLDFAPVRTGVSISRR